MTKENSGAFSDSMIRELADNKFILGLQEENLNPSSYDMCLNGDIYKVPHSFQVCKGKTIFQTIKDIGYEKHSMSEPLEKDGYYVIFLEETIDLPTDFYSYANPKSTTGRLDLHTRLIADCVSGYDYLPRGFSGKVACLVTSKSFPVILKSGLSLNQLRFFNGDARLNAHSLEFLMQREGILFTPEKEQLRYKDIDKQDDRSLLLRLGTNYDVVAYVAKTNVSDPIDLSKKNFYNWNDYFEIVEKRKDESIVFEKDRFYIAATYEHLLVPPDYAAEIADIDTRLGELRTHCAGFVDNGFGYGDYGEQKGAPIVLEIRAFEKTIVHHMQSIARIKFEPTIVRPERLYGQSGLGSNYSGQVGPKLAKQFKM